MVVCSARAPFFLSQILTSIETLFAFFCALRFFDLSISCVFDLPLCFAVENESVLRSKSAQKTRSSRKRSKRTVPFFSFFVLSLCSLVRDVTPDGEELAVDVQEDVAAGADAARPASGCAGARERPEVLGELRGRLDGLLGRHPDHQQRRGESGADPHDAAAELLLLRRGQRDVEP